MSHPALIGVRYGDDRFRHRYLHWANPPHLLIPKLIAIWDNTFHRDTTAMTDALLSKDWSRLSCDTAANSSTASTIVGVGTSMTHQYAQAGASLISDGRGDTHLQWLYLIDSTTGHVDVFEATVNDNWLLHSRHRLDHDSQSVPLTNGVDPIAEWVTPQGFAACHPELEYFPLPLISTALAALVPSGPAAIIAADRNPRTVWLIGHHHTIRVIVTPGPRSDTVLLPRPLAGSWAEDLPARVVPPEQVAAICQRLFTDYAVLLGSARWAVAHAAMAKAGAAAGRDSAEWWLQDTVGTRASGDITSTARKIVRGIDDSDPAVLDTLPSCPITSPDDPALAHAHHEHAEYIFGPWHTVEPIWREALYTSYDNGFSTEVESTIRRTCTDLQS